jgi:hypothetical protein
MEIEAGHSLERDDRRAEGAERHRRRVGDEREARSLERPEAEGDQDATGNGHRGAEARRALHERAEGEGDQQQLETAVVRDTGYPAPKGVEQATPLHDPVEENHVEHDPADPGAGRTPRQVARWRAPCGPACR